MFRNCAINRSNEVVTGNGAGFVAQAWAAGQRAGDHRASRRGSILLACLAAAIVTSVPMPAAQTGLQFNEGAAPESYSAQGPRGSVSITATEAVLRLGDGQGAPSLRMRLAGANPASKSRGLRRPEPAHAGSASWDRIRYQEVYPGVDVVYYGTQRQQLEYDFLVAPGASPDVIAMAFDGADEMTIDQRGDLVLIRRAVTLMASRSAAEPGGSRARPENSRCLARSISPRSR